MSTLDAAGPAARDVAGFWWVMLGGAGVLTALVLTLVALAFRRRGPGGGGGDDGLRLWLVWLGLALPGTVLVALLAYAVILGERSLAHPGPDVVVVEATGHQWYWSFRHPGPDGAVETRHVLHIPAGRPVDVRISSADVIHSFWVPRLGGKRDAIPGHVSVLRIEATNPGVYEGQCAEFCGLQHANNRFQVIAHDAAGWTAFQREGPP